MTTREQGQTPETDAITVKILSSLQSGTEDVVRADFARKLERERDRMREALQTIVSGDVGATWSGSQCVEIARAALASVKGEK